MNTKILLTAIIALVFMGTVHAQQFSIGPAISYNYTWINSGDTRSDGLHGAGLGAKFTYSTNEHWGISGLVGYSREGYTQDAEGLNAKTTFHYVRVPLRLDYFFGKFGDDFRPKIYAGPTVGILAKANAEVRDIKTDVTDAYKPIDLGVSVGTGFNYRLAEATWLNFDLTYTHGLVSIAENGPDIKNRGVNVAVGVAFGF